MHTIFDANATQLCICYPQYYRQNSFVTEKEFWPLSHVTNPLFLMLMVNRVAVPMCVIMAYEVVEEYSLFARARWGLPFSKKYELEPMDNAIDITFGFVGIVLALLLIAAGNRQSGFQYRGAFGKHWGFLLSQIRRRSRLYLSRWLKRAGRRVRTVLCRGVDRGPEQYVDSNVKGLRVHSKEAEMNALRTQRAQLRALRSTVPVSEPTEAEFWPLLVSQLCYFGVGWYFALLPDTVLLRLCTMLKRPYSHVWFRIDVVVYYLWIAQAIGIALFVHTARFNLWFFWGNCRGACVRFHLLALGVWTALCLPSVYTWADAFWTVSVGVVLASVLLISACCGRKRQMDDGIVLPM